MKRVENELGSHVAYMFGMAKAGRPDFQYARIHSLKPLRQYSYIGGAAFDFRIGGFQHLMPEREFPGHVAMK